MANTFSRGAVPSIANLEIICNALGLTISQFFSTEKDSVLMTKEELEVYKKYKKLNPEVRKVVNDVVFTYATLINN